MTATSPHDPDRPRPTSRTGKSGSGGRRPLQLTVICWLTVVWVALWGDLSIANIVSGLVLGALVCLVFPLPPLHMRLRVRPLRLGRLAVHFLWDVLVASYQVSVQTLRFRHQPRNAVIEVDLRTDSDFVLTVVAEMVSLVPGSLVVEARALTHTLFLHVLDVPDLAGVEAFRTRVLDLERRVVLAVGADTSPVEQPPPTPPSGGTPT